MPWRKDTIPAFFNGLRLFTQRAAKRQQFDIVEHKTGGLVNSLEAMGGENAVFPLTAVFGDTYFQYHKIFEELLNQCVATYTPGVLIHPVRGELSVYPLEYDTQIEAKEKIARVVVRFKNVLLEQTYGSLDRPQFPTANTGVPSVDLSGYLATLAWIEVLNSQFLANALAIMRHAGAVPSLVTESIIAAGQAFVGWALSYAEQWADSYFAVRNFSAQTVLEAWTPPDRIAEKFIADRGVDTERLDDILAGEDYDAGPYAAGRPARPGDSPPPADFHAQLTALALWRVTTSSVLGNYTAELIKIGARDQTLNHQTAARAVNLVRERLRDAMRLIGAALGVYGAPTKRQLSTLAATLLRLLAYVKQARMQRLTRVFEVDYPAPLAVLAARLLGDPRRAGEIRELNPDLKTDFNRLPAGTRLLVPVN